jgi:hypothetical protein
MKFFALLKKELRECLPWIILAALAILLIGGLFLQELAYREANEWSNKTFQSSLTINSSHPPLQDSAVVLFLTSISLGLILGFVQFWLPGFRGIWPFILHRSISRNVLLTAKIMAGAIAFILSCVIIWTGLYLYCCRPGLFWTPPAFKFYLEGCLLILIGFAVYLAMALSGLSSARWYTTKVLPLLFAAVILITVLGQWNLLYILVTLIAGILVILVQLFDIFLKKEF